MDVANDAGAPDAAAPDAAATESVDAAMPVAREAGTPDDGGTIPLGKATDAHALDKVSGATAAYGLRRLSSSYAGHLVRLTRSVDGANRDIDPTPSDEFPSVDVAAWAQGGTLTVVTWYDQSGHGNDIQSSGSPPTLKLDVFRGRPGVKFTAMTMTYLSASFAWVSENGPWSGSASVLGDVSSTGYYQPLFMYGAVSPTNSISMNTQLSSAFDYGMTCYGTSIPSSIATSAPAAFTASYDGTTYIGDVNGTSFSVAQGPAENVSATTFWMGGSPQQSGIWLNGSLGALVLYPIALTAAQKAMLQDTERSYYGF